jgi:hypothetical protein
MELCSKKLFHQECLWRHRHSITICVTRLNSPKSQRENHWIHSSIPLEAMTRLWRVSVMTGWRQPLDEDYRRTFDRIHWEDVRSVASVGLVETGPLLAKINYPVIENWRACDLPSSKALEHISFTMTMPCLRNLELSSSSVGSLISLLEGVSRCCTAIEHVSVLQKKFTNI